MWGAQEGQLSWNPSGLLSSLCSESQMTVLAGILFLTLNPTLSVPLLFAKVFRQQLAENLGAWVWEVERGQLFHLSHQYERYFHLLKLRLFCSTLIPGQKQASCLDLFFLMISMKRLLSRL